MKKKLLLIIISVFVLSLALTACGSDDKSKTNVNEESKNTILDKGKFVMGLDDSFPPMGFRDEHGEIVGFDIDLAQEAAKRMGLELETKAIDWNSNILVLNKGDIDVIWNGFTADADRRKKVNFTDTYLENKQILVVAKDSKIETKSDLEGKILGLQLGSTSSKALGKDRETSDSIGELREYSDNVKALLDLKIGRVDAVLVDEVVGRYYVSKQPDDYKVLKEHFGEEEYAVGVRKGEDEFLTKLNEALKEIREDGTEAEISKKWFGEDITK